MKKILAIVCAFCMAAISITGCGNKELQQTSSQNDIHLRFSFWEPSTGKEMETSLSKIKEEYEKKHPNVEIELVSQSVSGYQDWIKTQMAVDDLPEIEMNYAPNLISQYNAGAIANIGDALNSENSYNKNAIWQDMFIDGTLDAAHEYRVAKEFCIPLFQTGIAMYYNKKIYSDLGLKEPKNWSEFLENCKTIEKAGKTPIALMGQKKDAIRWLEYELMGGTCLEKWLADKNLNYNGDCNLSKYEVVKAIDSGDFNIATNKSYQEDFERYLDFAKQYIKYTPNASGLDEAAAKTLFLSGQAAHLNSGSWDITGLLKNDEIDFEVGVCKFPHLTRDDCEYAGKGISNNAVQTIAITSSVDKQEGARDAAIDFLKFLTSPEQYSLFVNDTYQIPSVKDVKVDPIFDVFIEEGYPLCILFVVGDSSVGKTFEDIFNEMVSGKNTELNTNTYSGIQSALESWSKTYMSSNDLSASNNYKLDNMPIFSGLFQK